MAPTTPTGAPSSLHRGDTWRWKAADHGEYTQADGWTLKYSLVGLDVLLITATWQTGGDDAYSWLVSEAPANTKQIQAGRYLLLEYYSGSGDYAGQEYTTRSTSIIVFDNHRAAKAGDMQSFAEKMIPILRASLSAVSTDKFIETYGISGRQVIRMPYQQRRAWLSSLEATRLQKSTGSLGRKVRVRF